MIHKRIQIHNIQEDPMQWNQLGKGKSYIWEQPMANISSNNTLRKSYWCNLGHY